MTFVDGWAWGICLRCGLASFRDRLSSGSYGSTIIPSFTWSEYGPILKGPTGLEETRNHIEAIHQLTLVFMNALNLDVNKSILIDLQAYLLLIT